ncbi:MAG: hypothetical protein F4Y86_18220 [Gammaproteobacteria bacterium]|nr:hypothetical protein [Gammaproteobacteria bacterium]
MADQALVWRRCMDAEERPQWCSLLRLDTASVTAEHGVYVVWHGGDEPETVLVGQAFFVTVGEQLARLRDDERLLAYADHGLFVTWAEVKDADLLDGVERYLGDRLEPLEGRVPDAVPLPVNLPWDEEDDD